MVHRSGERRYSSRKPVSGPTHWECSAVESRKWLRPSILSMRSSGGNEDGAAVEEVALAGSAA